MKSLEFLEIFIPNIYKDILSKEISDFLEKKVDPLIQRNDGECLKQLQTFFNRI